MLCISKSLRTEDIALHRNPLQYPVIPVSDVDPDMDRKRFLESIASSPSFLFSFRLYEYEEIQVE